MTRSTEPTDPTEQTLPIPNIVLQLLLESAVTESKADDVVAEPNVARGSSANLVALPSPSPHTVALAVKI